jgi:tetratricopeptide (TPR) repeat protein
MKSSKQLTAVFLSGVLLVCLVSCAGTMSKTPSQSEFDLGLSLFNLGKYEAAIPHFEQAAVLQPDFGRAYLYAGRCYVHLGRWREAVQPLRTAFRLTPVESRKEVVQTVLDVLIENAARLDIATTEQYKDILRQP